MTSRIDEISPFFKSPTLISRARVLGGLSLVPRGVDGRRMNLAFRTMPRVLINGTDGDAVDWSGIPFVKEELPCLLPLSTFHPASRGALRSSSTRKSPKAYTTLTRCQTLACTC